MSDAAPQSPAAPPSPAKGRFSVFTLGLIVGLVVAAVGYYLYEKSKNPEPAPVDEFAGLKGFFVRLRQTQNLAPEYKDENKDLIADIPSEQAKLLNVTQIGFSSIGTDDPERLAAEQALWMDLMQRVSKAAGKPVVYMTDVAHPEAQMAALREGKLHVTAFNTGAVPVAVNTAGFVPLFAPADDAGDFSIRMEIVVKASSPIQKPEDLKGKTLGFVALSSNSGAKAPMFALKEKFGMLPGRDYRFKYTGDHVASLVSIAEGSDLDAVCVASDLKDRALSSPFKFRGQDKTLKADQFRVIYTSEPMPPLCFGVPHNLPKDVRANIEKAFNEYRFAGTSADRFAKQGKTKFVAVNYEKDWKHVRDIDAALSRFADVP